MDDEDTKQELTIHVILGASEYAELKTSTVLRVGKPGEPVAELISFGWTIMSPGAEVNLSSVYLTRLLARWPSSNPKDGHFSEMGVFRRPVVGGNLRTSVLNVTKQCV